MKFKVGDKVKVTNTVYAFKRVYIGREVIIRNVNPNGVKNDETHYGVEHSLFIFWEHELEPVNEKKIVITTDGSETLARLYEGKNVIKSAVAKCSPEDEFCFETGVKLAFDRLVGEKPIEKATPSDFEIGEQYEYKSGLGEGIIKIVDRHDSWYFWEALEGMNGWDFKKFQKNSDFARTLKRIEKPKYYNGKVVCVETPYNKAFTVGKIYTVSDGVLRYDDGDIACVDKTSFKDIQKCFTSKFVEVVE